MTTESEITYDSFLSKETINAIPDEIIVMFENQVLAALEDVQMGLPFVGLKYFKNKILPRRLEYRAGYLLSQILVQRMITDGRLVVEQVPNTENPEYPVSVLKKGTK